MEYAASLDDESDQDSSESDSVAELQPFTSRGQDRRSRRGHGSNTRGRGRAGRGRTTTDPSVTANDGNFASQEDVFTCQ